MKKILFAMLLIAILAGCESKEERERAQKAEQFKQEQLQKLAPKAETKEVYRQEQPTNSSKIPQKEITVKSPVKENRAPQKEEDNESSTLNKMGVSMQDGKLIIDTNKAKEFFWSFQKKLDNTSRELDRELREGNLTVTVPMGVEIRREKVSIDLNKTRSFFDSWGEKMEAFVKEFDKMTRVLYDSNQTEQ